MPRQILISPSPTIATPALGGDLDGRLGLGWLTVLIAHYYLLNSLGH
jgi:hypothetical protein